jgi:hypothetical protein
MRFVTEGQNAMPAHAAQIAANRPLANHSLPESAATIPKREGARLTMTDTRQSQLTSQPFSPPEGLKRLAYGAAAVITPQCCSAYPSSTDPTRSLD